MQQAEIADVYQDLFSHFSDDPRRCLQPWQWDYLRRNLPEDRGLSILDAGCGNGCYSAALAGEGYGNVTGIDLFDHLDTGGAFRYRRCSIDEIDLPDESVDFVFCFSVIYYLPEPFRALREFHRVMKPGGLVVFSGHTRYSLFTLKRVIWRAFGQVPHLKGVRFRSVGSYVRMARAAGLRIVDADGYRLLRLPNSVARWLPRFSPPRTAAGRRTIPARSPQWMKRVRCALGYHFVIAARKPAGQGEGRPTASFEDRRAAVTVEHSR